MLLRTDAMTGSADRTYRAASATVAIVVGVAVVGLLAAGTQVVGDLGGWAVVGLLALIVVPLACMVVTVLRSSTRVGADGIVVQGLLRSRHIEWSAVQEIRVEANPAAMESSRAPQALMAVYEASGRRTVLPHVNEKNLARAGSDLMVEFQAIAETWLDRRGTGWTPDLRVAEMLAKRDAYRAPSEVGVIAMYGALPIVVVAFVVAHLAGAFERGFPLPGWTLPAAFLGLPAVAFVVGYLVQRIRMR